MAVMLLLAISAALGLDAITFVMAKVSTKLTMRASTLEVRWKRSASLTVGSYY